MLNDHSDRGHRVIRKHGSQFEISNLINCALVKRNVVYYPTLHERFSCMCRCKKYHVFFSHKRNGINIHVIKMIVGTDRDVAFQLFRGKRSPNHSSALGYTVNNI